MTGSYWVQIDVCCDSRSYRFYMRDGDGRDQVVRSVLLGGWEVFEQPLPYVIARLCIRWSPLFIDVGASTGYYSLLAASSGATRVFAIEPSPAIRESLMANVEESGLSNQVTVSESALMDMTSVVSLPPTETSRGLIENSASSKLNHGGSHSEFNTIHALPPDSILNGFGDFSTGEKEILMKVDVQTYGYLVIRDAFSHILLKRPIIFSELLPGCALEFLNSLISDQKYSCFDLKSSGEFSATKVIDGVSNSFRYHLFVPNEKVSNFFSCLLPLP